MKFATVINLILARAQDLGLKGADSGQVDASAVELLLLHTLQGLSDSWDFNGLTILPDGPLFTTHAGQSTYRLPDNFGRFLLPDDDEETGLFLTDTVSTWPLQYREPWTMRRMAEIEVQSRPGFYTLVADNQVRLAPIPDSNGGLDYIAQGVYIRAITAEVFDGDVPVTAPDALVHMVIAQMAIDHSHPNQQFLMMKGEEARSRMVNQNRRLRTRFQRKLSRQWTYTNVR